MAALNLQQQEVDDNFAYFLAELPNILPLHAGKFAVLRSRQIVGYYETIVDAWTAANNQFLDGLFSVQQVGQDAADLGYFSHAMYLGAA